MYIFAAQEQLGLGQFHVKCSIGRLVCQVVNFLLYAVVSFCQHQPYGPLIHVVLLIGAGVRSMRPRVLNRRRHPAIDRHLLWDL